jgi:hypothetical protein
MSGIQTRHRALKGGDRKQTTATRGQFRSEENLFLLEQFNDWFAAACPHHGRAENGGGAWEGVDAFCDELLDGVTLCQLAKQIEGTQLRKYHVRPKGVFHRRENVVFFVKACHRLKVPIVLTISNLEEAEQQPIVACLLTLARIAASQADMASSLPEAIMEKLETEAPPPVVALVDFETVEEEEVEDFSFAAIHSVTVLAVTPGAVPWSTNTEGGFVQYALSVYILKQAQEGGGVHPHARIEAHMSPSERGKALFKAATAEHFAVPGPSPDATPDHVVHRRYNEFLAVAALLEQIAQQSAGRSSKRACPHLPAKAWFSFHSGGSAERLSGLMQFLELDIFASSGGIDGGYTAAVKRSRERWPTVLDQQLIGVVRRFLGVEDGWEQLCSPATGKLVPNGLLSIAMERETHDDLDMLIG